MNKTIRTYEDLLLEEARLMADLKGQEVKIKESIAGIKEGLKPVRNVMGMLNKMSTRDETGPFVNMGIDFGVDLLIRKLLLAKAGWFTKIAVPFVLKNISSHVVSTEQKEAISKKVGDFFKKIRPKKSKVNTESTNT